MHIFKAFLSSALYSQWNVEARDPHSILHFVISVLIISYPILFTVLSPASDAGPLLTNQQWAI